MIFLILDFPLNLLNNFWLSFLMFPLLGELLPISAVLIEFCARGKRLQEKIHRNSVDHVNFDWSVNVTNVWRKYFVESFLFNVRKLTAYITFSLRYFESISEEFLPTYRNL